MNPLISETLKHSKFNALKEAIARKEKNISIIGLTEEAAVHMVCALYNYTNVRPVFVCPNISTARKTIQNLKFYSEKEIVFFPPREYVYYTTAAKSKEEENERVYAIKKILNDEDIIIVTTIDAVSENILNKDTYKNLNFRITVSETIDIYELIKRLDMLGYKREDVVSVKGKYSVRGGIIDIFVFEDEYPYRIELFGNEVDSIRRFDKDTQKSIENIDSFEISFSSEYIISKQRIDDTIKYLQEYVLDKDKELKENILSDIELLSQNEIEEVIDKYFKLLVKDESSILDYLNNKYAIYFDEVSKCINRSQSITEEEKETIKILKKKNEIVEEFVSTHFSFDEILKKTNRLSDVFLSRVDKDRVLHAKRKEYSFSCREVNFFRSSMDLFIKEIKKFKSEKKLIFIGLSSELKIDMMIEALNENNIFATKLNNISEINTLEKGKVYIAEAFITSGYVIDDLDIVVAAEEITNIKRRDTIKKEELIGSIIQSFEDLEIGDYVVHQTYGIGKYLGTETITTDKVSKDYIKIEYKDSSKLYIPITSLDFIRKYVCEEGYVPKVNSLTSNAWEKTKQRVKEHTKDIAKDLIVLYAERKAKKGFKFSLDTPWQREFESDFEYELTYDQKKAIEELKCDMEKEMPMDRILCGDVGYGKTEIAIRGAFKSCMDSKQVAYLVPTTILCMQQYNVFKNRMEKFGIKVEMLSRFKTKSEQLNIIKELKEGNIDIIIGTHRLLSADVMFKDLGFLIIDEEHKFGVEHKEKIKKLRKNIDVLSMTATPIPRTLHMSMIGIYDISVILEPPLERLPVKTYVLEYDTELIQSAIEKELARDGQIIYLNNRVENIAKITEKVKKLAKSARVEFAHGKENAKDIEDKMISFINHDIDILVCTTILESGIDIPNANTLIIENADRLGLASLYQIRGRVGRSSRLAYAYITYRKNNVITEEAMKRLNAIKEYTEFGSGLKIALKDLEIRGAGNILGEKQHGHMISVGYDMYVNMLKEAIEIEKNKLTNQETEKVVEEKIKEKYIENKIEDVKISIDISANIPDEYINSSVVKINMYQKLSNAKTDEELKNITNELVDRFGEIPIETLNLIQIIHIRNMARILNINEIKTTGDYILFISKYHQNNIKYKLTDELKYDILSYIKLTLISFMKKLKVEEKG